MTKPKPPKPMPWPWPFPISNGQRVKPPPGYFLKRKPEDLPDAPF